MPDTTPRSAALAPPVPQVEVPQVATPAEAAGTARGALVAEIEGIPDPQTETSMARENFDADIVVIGAGPGGYVGAIRAAQLGAKVICVEKEYLGGTCLNWGCIPSKAMIASVERLHHVNGADKMGVKLPEGPDGKPVRATADFGAIMARKDKIVQTQRGGVGMLFKKNGVESVMGTARFTDANTIVVTNPDPVAGAAPGAVAAGTERTIRAKAFVVATGAKAIRFAIPGLEGGRAEGVWTSDDAVTADHVPPRMVILGGGAVGCEFGYVFSGLGSQVTLVELADGLIPQMDRDLGSELAKILGRSGMKIKTGSTIDSCKRTKGEGGDVWHVTVKKGDATEVIEADVVLLGVGRKANTEGLGLEEIGVKMHKRGIQVKDDTMVTDVPSIYAIGDVTGRIQLAHVASHEGQVAVENIVKGTHKLADYKAVPNAVYTSPEVASVGLTQAEAEAKGYDVQIGKFAFRPLGKPMATGEQEGFVKIVAEKKYGEVLGVHMIGAHVTDMIHEAVVALKLEATLESMIDTIHAHPTMAEAVLEAYEDAAGHAIHKL